MRLFLLLLLSIVQLHSNLAALRSPKSKTAKSKKAINWDLKYYSEPFSPCKSLKEWSPVEQAKAHHVAVEIFRKCGPSLVIPYAARFKFPAYAIGKAGEIICFICNLGGGYFDLIGLGNDGVAPDLDNILTLIRNFCASWKRINHTIKVKHKSESFILDADMCGSFVYDVLACGLKKTGTRDSEYAKFAVTHFVKMLL